MKTWPSGAMIRFPFSCRFVQLGGPERPAISRAQATKQARGDIQSVVSDVPRLLPSRSDDTMVAVGFNPRSMTPTSRSSRSDDPKPWRTGTVHFPLSKSNLPSVIAPIQWQRAHHRTKTFQEEYRELLKPYEIEFDERRLWG